MEKIVNPTTPSDLFFSVYFFLVGINIYIFFSCSALEVSETLVSGLVN